MTLFDRKRKQHPTGAEYLPDWPEGLPLPLDHPGLPPSIIKALQSHAKSGDYLHRVDCDGSVEWWLFDLDGNLVEAFCSG